MAVGFSNTNKPINPRGNDASPKGYNRAKLFSGKALDFDGVNDYVGITSATDLWTGDFSVSWYGDLDVTANQFAFSSGIYHGSVQAGINFWYGGASNKNFTVHFPESDGTGQQGYNLTLAESYEYLHRIDLVFVSSSRLLSLYQNGILADTATVASNVDAAYMPNGWDFGRSYGGGYPLNGKLTNLKAFNVPLTAAQVADLYNNPEKVVPTGVDNTALKLWLPMQEGAGTTAYDGSGNGNHGTISGATYTHGIGAPVAQTAVIDWNKGVNLFEYSEEFDNAYWPKGGNTTLTSGQEAPDGSANAYRLQMIAGSGTYLYQSKSTVIGQDYTISVWAKANTESYFCFVSGTNFDEITITNEWARYSVTFTASSSTTTIGFDNGATGNVVDCFIWGAQVEASDSLGAYIPNHTGTPITSPVLLPQGLTTGRDITGVNLFENVRKQGALNLDGNSWAEVHDNASLDISPAMTMEAWFNCDDISSGSYETIFAKPSATTWVYPFAQYDLRVISANVQWWFEGTFYVAQYHVSLTGWNHLLVTKNGTSEILYINGVQVATHTGNAAISASPYDLILGANTDKMEKASSQIAQPRIYNRALTAAEVLQNYNSGKNTYK